MVDVYWKEKKMYLYIDDWKIEIHAYLDINCKYIY